MATQLLCSPHRFPLTHSLNKLFPQRAIQGTSTPRPIRCSVNTKTSNLTANRRSANFQPSTWSYDFVQSLKNDYVGKPYEDRVKKLEEDVRSMINYENTELLATLELIDDIQRLGLGYRFEKDIKRALDRFVSARGCYDRIIEKSLHATALSFRLLRQHGYEVSQDVFNSFKDNNGNFKACLSKDVKGMLSLYEASYLAFEGENLLDEAAAFTNIHLKNLNRDVISKSLEEQISHALELPLHHRMQRLEARCYIEAYDKREDANLVLLELAKLDFNIVQSILQTDLQDMSRWWKCMGLTNKLSFSRDRLVESFFWTVGMVFEPQFSNPRKGLTKVVSFITTIDDIYDVYGTLDELELFTDAVERWDVNAVKILPDYMKLSFLALYNTVNEMAYDTLKDKGVNSLPYLTKAWDDMCKAFLQEAKWSHNKDTPTFKEYIDNGWQSVSGVVLLVHAYFLLNQNITKQALEGLECYHDLLRWPSMIFRLSNDLSTSAAESERGETANSIVCYMRDTSLSEELAYKHISSMIDKTWEKMNEERVVDSPFAQPFVETAINLARIAQCTYQYGDGYGAPDSRSKNRVLSLIMDPISLTER